jgi:hypothetical protein
MKKKLILLGILFQSMMVSICSAQTKVLDIPNLHLLVNESISENKLQVDARNKQALATANEQANLTLLSKLKGSYRQLQQRFNTLGTAINLAEIGLYATPMVNRIISNQAQVIALVEKSPALALTGYRSELLFTAKARSLLNYIAGLSLSLGDVNQMKASDRKMLFDYVISELTVIQDLSGNMLSMMQYSSLAGMLRAVNPFRDFVDTDINIGKDILQNTKYLK